MTQISEICGIARDRVTPFYHYDIALLRRTLSAATSAAAINDKFRLHYAMKACYDPEVLKAVRDHGLGVDTVSGGEIEMALACGFNPSGILFAGVGKTDQEINLALEAGIGAFNVESLPELHAISRQAVAAAKTARVCLRVNPDIDAHTHRYITTGLEENKFGINLSGLLRTVDTALQLPGIMFDGLHFHIGSQITVSEPFRLLCSRVNDIVGSIRRRGIAVRTLNMGGGLGIDYDNPESNPIPDFKSYFDIFNEGLDLDGIDEVRFEPGRALVGQCGSLITRVVYVKEGDNRTFVIADAGMTELIRPALYSARHKIVNLTGSLRNDRLRKVDVVGPVCESADVFGKDYMIAWPVAGDILAVRSAGAYGEVMGSRYNARSHGEAAYSK